MISRRKLLAALGGVAVWPRAASAQQRELPLVAYVTGGNARSGAAAVYVQALREMGFIDGHNITFETRYADNQYERLPAIIADLIRKRPAVIIAGGAPPAVPAKAATSTIPIVFNMGEDPVSLGLIASLNRPG